MERVSSEIIYRKKGKLFRRVVYTRRTLRIVTRVWQPSDIKSACVQMAAVRGWSKKIKRRGHEERRCLCFHARWVILK
ncbi:hypothetical protein DBV15_06822 [Temnothorax longispinosus]|uniref:Uncharacterized protein n=1 Tax=Temnothorax longispinosus TaxID=300112 RepID=A0A4S2JDF4_9HYME|nr:hypothetical protein DBV15_06822 [Temnothorax longispinosus]